MSKIRKAMNLAAVIAFLSPLALIACDRAVSSTSQRTVNPDGSTKTKEKSVTESANGSVTKEESTKTTPPTKP